MYVEVSVAVNYLLAHLYTKLPRRRVDNFGEELERCLFRKLQPHWFVDTPTQDASQRCLQTSGPQADFLFAEAAISSGLDWNEIQACLPNGLIISIDPGYVACQYGSNESSSVLPNSAWTPNGFHSMSLSSSGCSSASSVSSNTSSGSWPKTKHQVLYTVSSKDTVSTAQLCEKETELPPTDFKKSVDDNHTHLATEAALSVLTEPDDVPSPTGFELSQVAHDVKSQSLNSELNQILPVNAPVSKQNIEINSFPAGTIVDGMNINALGQSSKCFNELQVSRCNDTSTANIRTTGINQFVPTDATGDGTLYDNLTVEAAKTTLGDIESQFYTCPQKQVRPVTNSTSLVDGMGEHEFQQGPQAAIEQNFNSTVNFMQKSIPAPSFTAATFAATKFGSTKLKSQTKRPHRLVSPSKNSNQPYPSQVLEHMVQTPISASQMCSNDMRRSGAYGVSNFMGESSRGYYGNYPGLIDRGQQESIGGIGYGGFLEGTPFFSSPSGHNSGNTRGMMNSALLSQFEKIRNEFQMKHSQYVDPVSSDVSMMSNMRSNYSQMSWDYSSNFNRKNEGIPLGLLTDFHQDSAPHISRAPGSIGDGKRSTPNSFIDDSLNVDLQDLWNSQKLGGFCWPRDKSSPGIDTSIGQMFNGLNISEL